MPAWVRCNCLSQDERIDLLPLVLCGPDVSRERRYLATSPQQLMATKDKNRQRKNLISVLGGSGVCRELEQKLKTLQRCTNSTPREFAFKRTNIPGQKLDNNSNYRKTLAIKKLPGVQETPDHSTKALQNFMSKMPDQRLPQSS